MSSGFRYERTFLMFEREDKGYESVREPSGYIKIETKGEKTKLTALVQNLKDSDKAGEYSLYIIKSAHDVVPVLIGKVRVERNKGEASWDVDTDNVKGTGLGIGAFNIAVLLAADSDVSKGKVICPLAAYKGKKEDWRKAFKKETVSRPENELRVQSGEPEPKDGIRTEKTVKAKEEYINNTALKPNDVYIDGNERTGKPDGDKGQNKKDTGTDNLTASLTETAGTATCGFKADGESELDVSPKFDDAASKKQEIFSRYDAIIVSKYVNSEAKDKDKNDEKSETEGVSIASGTCEELLAETLSKRITGYSTPRMPENQNMQNSPSMDLHENVATAVNRQTEMYHPEEAKSPAGTGLSTPADSAAAVGTSGSVASSTPVRPFVSVSASDDSSAPANSSAAVGTSSQVGSPAPVRPSSSVSASTDSPAPADSSAAVGTSSQMGSPTSVRPSSSVSASTDSSAPADSPAAMSTPNPVGSPAPMRPFAGSPALMNCPYSSGGECIWTNVNSEGALCSNCFTEGERNAGGSHMADSERIGSTETLKESFDRFFERCDPFGSKRRDYTWWKVVSPVHLNNILYKFDVKSSLLFNPRVLMAHFKYRHLIAGIYQDRITGKVLLVCGVPGTYGVDEKPYGDMCRWAQVERGKPRYGVFGYWLVYMDARTGKLINVH